MIFLIHSNIPDFIIESDSKEELDNIFISAIQRTHDTKSDPLGYRNNISMFAELFKLRKEPKYAINYKGPIDQEFTMEYRKY